RAGREQPVGAVVADRGDDADAGVDHGVGRGGRRVLGPGGERGADGDVDDVHAVVVGRLHGGQHDVGRGRPLAPEDPVGTDHCVGGDAADAVLLRVTVGRGDPGHVGAVPVAVVGVAVRPRHGVVVRGARVGVVGVADEVPAVPHL